MVFPHCLITTQVLTLKWSSITSNTVLTFIPYLLISLVLDLSYALSLVLASCSMGSPCSYMSVVSLVFPSMLLDTLGQLARDQVALEQTDGGFGASLYTGYLPIAFWASLSSCMHHGIACPASQAYDWPSACWSSLSGIHPSVALVSLAMIGHSSDRLTEPLTSPLTI